MSPKCARWEPINLKRAALDLAVIPSARNFGNILRPVVNTTFAVGGRATNSQVSMNIARLPREILSVSISWGSPGRENSSA